MIEAASTFRCFGSICAVRVLDGTAAAGAVALVRERLLDWHRRFTRFEASSELSRFNADPRDAVPASDDLLALAAAAADAARNSGGLVDATLLRELEDSGYRTDLRTELPLALALRSRRRGGRPACAGGPLAGLGRRRRVRRAHASRGRAAVAASYGGSGSWPPSPWTSPTWSSATRRAPRRCAACR